jgi:Ca2+-binding RTX toxin-like protein
MAILNGTNGKNRILGTSQADTIYGLGGDDSLNGGFGADVLYGGDGNDFLYGASGNDSLEGGNGRDVLAGEYGNDTLRGGDGNDGMWGGTLNDLLLGEAGDDNMVGDAGNDTLAGGLGTDTMAGGTGDDRFEIGLGDGSDVIFDIAGTADVLALGAGLTATGYTRSGNNLIVSLSSGDTVRITDHFAGKTVESLVLSNGTITDLVNGINLRVLGTSAADTLNGWLGNDTIYGYAGNDRLFGLAGDDLLIGGSGTDTMTGGTGNDTYEVDSSGDLVVELAGEGADLVLSSITYALGSNVENLSLTGSANINGYGNNGDNVITGNSGNNILSGGNGIDVLLGGDGADMLYGGNGDDILRSGRGADIMWGDNGSDRFVWEMSDLFDGRYHGRDIIMDFSKADRLDVSALIPDGKDPLDILDLRSTSSGMVLSVLVPDDGNYYEVVLLRGVHGLNLEAMIHDGLLLV